MIQKFLAKYILEVIPSIVATVIGAYIVTHYINAKTDTDKPAAAASSPATPVKAVSGAPDKSRPETTKPESARTEAAKPEPTKVEPAKTEAVRSEPQPMKSDAATSEPEKSTSEKSAQAARVLHRHQLLMKERATAKAAAPLPAEATATPEDRRDANEIARAAIERLRGTEPRAAEGAKPTEHVKVNTVGYAPVQVPVQTPVQVPAPVQAAVPMQPLPPAAYVPPPAREASIPMSAPMPTTVTPLPVPPPPSSVPVARFNDPSRPTPPADIPSQPLDIRAKDTNTSVAEDVVSAAKSAFQSVLPR